MKLLLASKGKVDNNEVTFQGDFHNFCRGRFGFEAQNNAPCKDTHDVSFWLDHLVNQNMGVELLIRASGDNAVPKGLTSLTNATWTSLKEHAQRGEKEYSAIARACTSGYATVLLASLGSDTEQRAWEQFQARINEWRQKYPNALKHPIIVAVAPFGWAKWNVFLHRPGSEPLKLEVNRQHLMYKLVGDELMSARNFYPRPTSVWVRHMHANLSFIAARADKVKPEEDAITSLASAICQHFGIVSRLAWITRWPAGICPADTFLRCVFAARSCPVHV